MVLKPAMANYYMLECVYELLKWVCKWVIERTSPNEIQLQYIPRGMTMTLFWLWMTKAVFAPVWRSLSVRQVLPTAAQKKNTESQHK